MVLQDLYYCYNNLQAASSSVEEKVCFIYLCCVSFPVKSILNVRLSESTDKPNNVSVLELPGDILIVPQVSQYIKLHWIFHISEQRISCKQ